MVCMRDGGIAAAHGARQHRSERHGAHRRSFPMSPRGRARFIQPSSWLSTRACRIPCSPAHRSASASDRANRRHRDRDRACRRFARPHALAFRRAGLHGIRHAGAQGDQRRLAESRAVAEGRAKSSPVRAVALGPALPRAMRGANAAMAIEQSERFPGARTGGASDSFRACMRTPRTHVLHGTGRETFEAVELMQSIQKQPYTPAAGAKYPRGRFGQSLLQIARLIKADVGRGGGVRRYRRLGHARQRSGRAAAAGPTGRICCANSGSRWRPSSRTWATAWPMSWWSR